MHVEGDIWVHNKRTVGSLSSEKPSSAGEAPYRAARVATRLTACAGKLGVGCVLLSHCCCPCPLTTTGALWSKPFWEPLAAWTSMMMLMPWVVPVNTQNRLTATAHSSLVSGNGVDKGQVLVAPARRTRYEWVRRCQHVPHSKAESTYARPPSRNGVYCAPVAVSFCEGGDSKLKRRSCLTHHRDEPYMSTTCIINYAGDALPCKWLCLKRTWQKI